MNLVEHRFHVPDMSCGHCVATLVKALQPLGASLVADLPSRYITVKAPPALAREQLVQALIEAGYPPG